MSIGEPIGSAFGSLARSARAIDGQAVVAAFAADRELARDTAREWQLCAIHFSREIPFLKDFEHGGDAWRFLKATSFLIYWAESEHIDVDAAELYDIDHAIYAASLSRVAAPDEQQRRHRDLANVIGAAGDVVLRIRTRTSCRSLTKTRTVELAASDATLGSATPLPNRENSVSHSPDFRSVNFCGQEFCFSAMKSRVVQVLFENWQKGAPDTGQDCLIEAAESKRQDSSIAQLFRGDAAWGTMIIPGTTKGTFRISGDPPR